MSTLIDRIRALAQLRSPRELPALLVLSVFASTVPLLMRLPLPRLAALITRPARRRSPARGEIERLERLVGLAPRVAHPLVRTGCLTRGVTLFWFLRRAGLDVELRFGLDPGGERPLDPGGERALDPGAERQLGPGGKRPSDGHCWLTLDGEPFLEKRDPRPHFPEIYRFPLVLA